MELAVHFGQIDLAIGQYWASLGVLAIKIVPKKLTGGSVDAVKLAGITAHIEFAVVQHGAGKLSLDAVELPDQSWLAGCDFGTVEAHHAALGGFTVVFFALANVDQITLNDRRAVDAAWPENVAPQLDACSGLESVDPTVSATTHHGANTVDNGDNGS